MFNLGMLSSQGALSNRMPALGSAVARPNFPGFGGGMPSFPPMGAPIQSGWGQNQTGTNMLNWTPPAGMAGGAGTQANPYMLGGMTPQKTPGMPVNTLTDPRYQQGKTGWWNPAMQQPPAVMPGSQGNPYMLGGAQGQSPMFQGGMTGGNPAQSGRGPMAGGLEPFIAQYLARLQSMGPQRVAQDQMGSTRQMGNMPWWGGMMR